MAMLLLTLGDTHPKKSPKFLYICVAFHIFVVSEWTFLMTKISAKFEWDDPQYGWQMQVGYVKMGDFR